MPENAQNAILALLADRSADASICPSEVARAISTDDDWRASMPTVHTAIDALLQEGIIQLSWKGRCLEKRTGPYRISRLRRC
ncbi:hypothetical protein BWQ93_08145 [Sphingopyxis sp. QXT-31]|uniref:DUF3253 domain-containing protein n=1 Tax=Sphingopyxis sp. QXT-31 TaxID=1357916 RepID=UPI0009792F62|nr:DUF3253 domain-containing protein [Sphingopyxis sp. QXT-31]APZ98465.1 hypothetical protein BWQ93_08145 [Sphingopyxis sp. QXT-31]